MAGTICSRCHERRWPFKNWQEPYLCQRCRDSLEGKPNTIDPLPSDAQREAWAAAATRLKEAREARQAQSFLASTGIPEDLAEPPSLDTPELAPEPEETEQDTPVVARLAIEPSKYPAIPWDQDRVRTLQLAMPAPVGSMPVAHRDVTWVR